MVEGRISAGVVVGDGSDVGGGSSIMGTLSGGGSEVISIGERCLLGANAGIGISLGDECTVEAGLYVTAGTRDHAARRRDRQGHASSAAPTACCSGATRGPARSRRCRARASGPGSTRRCTRTTDRSIQCQASPQVRDRSGAGASHLEGGDLDRDRRERGHPRVDLDAEHVGAARRQPPATLPVPQPTSSTRDGAGRDEVVDQCARRAGRSGRTRPRSRRRTRPGAVTVR